MKLYSIICVKIRPIKVLAWFKALYRYNVHSLPRNKGGGGMVHSGGGGGAGFMLLCLVQAYCSSAIEIVNSSLIMQHVRYGIYTMACNISWYVT